MKQLKKESSVITVKVDTKIKNEVSKVLEQLGTNTSNVINMLLHQIAIQKEIPFEITLKKKKELLKRLWGVEWLKVYLESNIRG